MSASAASTSQIDLTWTDGSDNETGFKVERAASSGGPFSQVADLAAGSTSYSDTGLTESTTYYYRVFAYNADGNSGNSNTASATTQSTTPPPAGLGPAAPTGLTATAKRWKRIDLKWKDESRNERGFLIERATSESGPYVRIGKTRAGKTQFQDKKVAPSTTYYYRVSAYNRDGISEFSNTASATSYGKRHGGRGGHDDDDDHDDDDHDDDDD